MCVQEGAAMETSKEKRLRDWGKRAGEDHWSYLSPSPPERVTGPDVWLCEKAFSAPSSIFLESLNLILQAAINLILSPLTSLIVLFQRQLVSY